MEGEDLLYREADAWYLPREGDQCVDADVCLDTRKRPEAVKAREGYLAAWEAPPLLPEFL